MFPYTSLSIEFIELVIIYPTQYTIMSILVPLAYYMQKNPLRLDMSFKVSLL